MIRVVVHQPLTRSFLGGLVMLAGWVFSDHTTFGQCLSVTQRLQRLDSVMSLPNDQQTKALLTIKKQSETCGQTSDSLYARTIHRLGVMAFQKADYIQAAQFARQAIRVNSLPGLAVNRAFRVKSCYNLARALQASGARLQAREAFEKVVQLGGQTSQYQDLVADSFGNLSHLYTESADYQKAIEQAEQGALLSGKAKFPDKLVFNLNAKAIAHKELGQYELAEKTLMQVLTLLKQTSVQVVDIANTYSDLANLRKRQGRFAEARQYYQKALVQHTILKNAYGRAEVLTNVGYLEFLYSHDYPKALSLYRQALPLMDQREGKARILNNISAVLWKQKQFEEAIKTYQDALKILTTLRHDGENPMANQVRVSPYKEYLLTLIQDKADTWLDYAKATGNNPKRLRQALATYTVADQMIDFMRWEHAGQQSKLFWRQKTRKLYEHAIETCFLLGDSEQAFRFLEKSRAVMLTDKLNELGARQQLTLVQIAQEQQLRQSVNNQQNTVANLPSDNGPAFNAARMALFAKQDSLTAFLKNLEASNPAYYRYKYDTTVIALATVKRYLKSQSDALVTYFVGDSALYLMAVTSDKAVLKKQSIKAYTKALHQFAGLLANSAAMSKRTDVSRFLGLSNDLYRQLLAPLGLPKGRVVVSPDGFFVPFDALSRSADKAEFAVNDYAFSYVYSVGLLLKNGLTSSRNQAFQSTDFLGIAPVEFAPSLNQVILPGSDVALNPIAERFAGSTLLTHAKATKAAFLDKAATARVIHLFTHATADSSDREPSLYFADSTLQLSDLRDGVLPNAELVVLAACKTGIGANQQGEGVFSLARGFAALGVPSVLTTLWSVQNEATYQLTDLFYAYLDQGLPKDVALQRAKQDWLSTAEGENRLPNYWAGLILVGDSKPLVHLSYSPWVGIVSLLVVIGLGGIWFWRNRERRATAVFSAVHSA